MTEATIYKKRLKEGPSTTEPESVVGLLRFSCCSESWEVNLDATGKCCCPDCQTVYQISLRKVGVLAKEENFPPGTKVYLSEEVELSFGGLPTRLLKGWYLIGLDLFGSLPISPGECFLEYSATTPTGELFSALVRVPRNLLSREIEVEPDRTSRDLHSSNSGMLADPIESGTPHLSETQSPDLGDNIHKRESGGDSLLEGGDFSHVREISSPGGGSEQEEDGPRTLVEAGTPRSEVSDASRDESSEDLSRGKDSLSGEFC